MDIGFVLAVILALIYAASIDLEALTLIPQQKWFSFAGGVLAAYVVLDIFPRLNQFPLSVQQGDNNISPSLRTGFYILILAGILVFYGLEKLALRSRNVNRSKSLGDCTALPVHVLHIIVFAAYSLMLGGLLRSYDFESHIIERSLLFVVLILHFMVNDYRLSEHHKAAYRRIGRWFLVGAIFLGALAPVTYLKNGFLAYPVWAFVSGGMILNALNEELSEKNTSCFWSFCFGVVVFSIVLLLLT